MTSSRRRTRSISEFSLEVSGLSALIGGVFGFLVANAALHRADASRDPGCIRLLFGYGG